MWYKKASWLVNGIFLIARYLWWQLCIKVSNEEKFLLFQHGEINGKSTMLSYWHSYARMQIYDNIDPNWAIEVCKWNVKITICSFPYMGKSKELNYVRKSAHEVISGLNNPPWYWANQYGQFDLLQQLKWVLFTPKAP